MTDLGAKGFFGGGSCTRKKLLNVSEKCSTWKGIVYQEHFNKGCYLRISVDLFTA